ncbi:MAG TPA: hypothetical protein VKS25_14175 [Solirubrobacteraceae bacterium]|nr:hypothetical protein [Solirubrobacteraceae bacterium]
MSAHERPPALIPVQQAPAFERVGLNAGTISFDDDPVGTNSFFVCRRDGG